MENEQPTIVRSTAENQVSRRPNKSVMKRIILPLFILIILIEVIVGAKTLLSPISTTIGKGKQAQALGPGKISILTARNTYGSGEAIPVAIRVSTGGHATDGTDLTLKYDPNYLDITGPKSFTGGSVYSQYPVVSIDKKSGTIRVSGIDSSQSDAFSGMGDLGMLVFTAKKVGATTLSVEYQPNTTTLSNIIETSTAKNLLEASSSLSLTIASGKVSSSLSSSPACSERVYQLCKDGSGLLGTQWCSSIDDPLSCNAGCFKDQFGSERGCKVINESSSAQ